MKIKNLKLINKSFSMKEKKIIVAIFFKEVRSFLVSLQRNHCGFSLISTLIALVLTGAIVIIITSVINLQTKETISGKRQLFSSSLRFDMLNALINDQCSCQISLNNFSIDKDKIPTHLNLKSFFRRCNPPEVLVTSDPSQQPLKDTGLYVKDVKIGDIQLLKEEADAFRYKGNLIVNYDENRNSLVRVPRPISIPVILQVDKYDAHGVDSDKVTACWGDHEYSCYITDVDSERGNTILGCGGWPERIKDLTALQQTKVTVLGRKAGNPASTTGSDNVYIGYMSGDEHTGTNSIFIGSKAGHTITNRDNLLVIGNETNPEWLKGVMRGVSSGFPDLRINNNRVIFRDQITNLTDAVRDATTEALDHCHNQVDDHAAAHGLATSSERSSFSCSANAIAP